MLLSIVVSFTYFNMSDIFCLKKGAITDAIGTGSCDSKSLGDDRLLGGDHCDRHSLPFPLGKSCTDFNLLDVLRRPLRCELTAWSAKRRPF